MDRHEDGRVENRGTILVASTNGLFRDDVGRMVADSGFTPAYPAGFESPWVSVMRTQPRIVICDCDAPIQRVQRLIFEASARRVVFKWLTLPVSHDAFCSMLDALLPPLTRAVHRGMPTAPRTL
jgi:hypothetical protein